jgi:carbon-monoxide dehydrogenase small subunit
MKLSITLNVNGTNHSALVEPHWTLAYLLREVLGLTGTKVACGTGDCGCCTVIVDGRAILSCITLAAAADGMQIETIESVSTEFKEHMHPIQGAFAEMGAAQCGFCIPGMIMNMRAFLGENPTRTEEDLRRALGGNICRCTGYTKQIEALIDARDSLTCKRRQSH